MDLGHLAYPRPVATNRVVVLFTRGPGDEARAKGLPMEAGSRLFAGFMRTWRRRAREIGAELLAVVPASSTRSIARLLPNVRVAPQSGRDFGNQLECAFQSAFDGGAATVAAVAGDSPAPACETLENVFRHLEDSSRAMAITRAEDGGVNLLGFAASAPRNLTSVGWFGAGVSDDLTRLAEQCSLPLLVQASSFDIDNLGDVVELHRRSLSQAEWLPFRSLLAATLAQSYGPAPDSAATPETPAFPRDAVRGPPASSP